MCLDVDKKSIDKFVGEAKGQGFRTLIEPEVKTILKASEIPVPKFKVVKDMAEAVEEAEHIGYPVVLKVISHDILHKSEAGGVITNLKDTKDIESAWSEMFFNVADNAPTASIEGFLVEEMAPQGVEVIVGGLRDEQFGPAVMFGIGGVAVELLKDTSFRLAPVEKQEALEMMTEVKGYRLLTGFRGAEPRDIDAVSDVIVKLSKILDSADGVKELEINPLVVYEKGVVAVDARAILA
jgi:acetyl-CoA synthetase (ADP-forming)